MKKKLLLVFGIVMVISLVVIIKMYIDLRDKYETASVYIENEKKDNILAKKIDLLQSKGIDENNSGLLILKKLNQNVSELSKGKTFSIFKEGKYSPVYSFLALSKMMDEDVINKITSNTLSEKDPYSGITGLIERAYISEIDSELDSYIAYVPKNYNPDKKYPLIVLLHGYGGGAYLPEDSPSYTTFLKQCENKEVIMIAPNGKNKAPKISRYYEDGEKDVLQVIELAKKAYNIDESRLYLTGNSMGGHGTLYIASRNKDIFAAIAPVCGYAEGWQGSKVIDIEKLKGLPTYVVHGDADKTVTVTESRNIVSKLKQLGQEVVYKELPGVDHNAEDYAYGNDELISWLLTHKKN